MKCPLCEIETDLVRSHIIPEFFYRPMYDAKHKMFLLSQTGSHPIMTRQTGEWERLLCEDCDNGFSAHENYVQRLLHGKTEVTASQEKQMYTLTGCDYEHIRLCFLSILWKMSVSSRPMFKNVELGPREKDLAVLLRNNSPGEPDQFGFFCSIPLLKGQVLDQLVLEPSWVRYEGHRIYRAVMGGIVVMYVVSSHRPAQEMQAFFVQPDGTWRLLAKPVEDSPFIFRSLLNMVKNND